MLAAAPPATASRGGAASAIVSLSGTRIVNTASSALGGAGGYASGKGNSGGKGGNAVASGIGNSTAGNVLVNASAIGGKGASSSQGKGGDSGAATATAKGTSATGQAQVSASATAYRGGSGGTGAGLAGESHATATAVGVSGSAQATATTSGGFLNNLTATSQAPVNHSSSIADSLANVGGPIKAASSAPVSASSYAYATGLVNYANLGPHVAAHFNDPAMITFGSGALGAHYAAGATGSQTYTSSIDWTLDPATAKLPNNGHVYLGLVDKISTGASFSQLILSVTENNTTTLLSQTFTSLAVANNYFTDHLLDLGAWKGHLQVGQLLDLKVSLSLTLAGAGGYGFDFVFGDPPPPPSVPEPGTLALFGLGFGLARRFGRKSTVPR